MKLVFLLIFLVSCGSDKDAYTTESEQVDDMPRSGVLTCSHQGSVVVCANETITFRMDKYRNTGRYDIRTQK